MEFDKKYCRVCLFKPTPEQTMIFDNSGNLNYREIFAITTGIDLSFCMEDEPQALCKDCAVDLKIAYNFKEKVEIANRIIYQKQLQVHNQPCDIEQNEEEMSAEQEHNRENVQELEYESIEELITDEEILDPNITENSNSECLMTDTDDNGMVPSPNETVNNNDNDNEPEREFLVMKKNHPKNKYACSFCKKQFRSFWRTIAHQRFIHQENTPKYPCMMCKRSYTTKQARRTHELGAHALDGEYACEVCGKRFPTLKQFEMHTRYHTLDFPFECVQCGRRFAEHSSLETHRNVKHEICRHHCEFKNCDKLFETSAALRNHQEYSH